MDSYTTFFYIIFGMVFLFALIRNSGKKSESFKNNNISDNQEAEKHLQHQKFIDQLNQQTNLQIQEDINRTLQQMQTGQQHLHQHIHDNVNLNNTPANTFDSTVGSDSGCSGNFDSTSS